MMDYKIVKYCKSCRKRYVVNRGETRKVYCTDCQKRYDKENNKE